MSKDDAKVLYLSWLAQAQPLVYARAVAVAKKSLLDRKLAGLGALSGWLDTLVGAAVTVGGVLVAKKQADQAASLQKKQQAADLQLALLDVNTRRAQAGLPPVDLNGNAIPAAQLSVPAALNRANVLTPALSNTMMNAGTMNADGLSYLPWLIGGAVAVLGLVLVTRGR